MKKNKLEKFLKLTASKDLARPILNCVHFDKDGSITVTDSHVLLRLDDAHSLEENFNLNLLTFEEDESNYPDTKGLIPATSKRSLSFKSTDGADTAKLLRGLKGTGDLAVGVAGDGDNLIIEQDGFKTKLKMTYGADRSVQFHCNSQLLAQALEFFAALGDPRSVDVSLGFDAELMPIVFHADKATYLVTPVRVMG